MSISLSGIQRPLRTIILALLPSSLVVICLAVLATQFSELGTANEILSLTSFITLLSFSALAFNWSRVSTSFTDEELLRVVYQAGMDLFMASLLALISGFFAWLQSNPKMLPNFFLLILFTLHWIFLALSLLLFVISMLQLLSTIKIILKK